MEIASDKLDAMERSHHCTTQQPLPEDNWSAEKEQVKGVEQLKLR